MIPAPRSTLEDARRFADFLIEEQGLDRAFATALEAANIPEDGDGDVLWQQVLRILADRRAT